MPFVLTNPIAAKDSAGTAIPGGLLAGDLDDGVGPQFLFHGLVDGGAGVNVAGVDSSNRLAVLADLGSVDNAVLDSIAALLGTMDADTSILAAFDFATESGGNLDDINTAVTALAALISGGNFKVTIDSAQISAAQTSDTTQSTGYTLTDLPTDSSIFQGPKVAASAIPVVNASDRQNTQFTSVTLTPAADTYAAGDVVADTQIVSACVNKDDGAGVLHSVTVFDVDDQAAYDLDINIHRTSTSLGTEGSAISISAANAAAAELKTISFDSTTDVIDFINCKKYEKTGLNIPIRAVSGADDIYISAVCRSGTPTHTTSGLIVVIGILND